MGLIDDPMTAVFTESQWNVVKSLFERGKGMNRAMFIPWFRRRPSNV